MLSRRSLLVAILVVLCLTQATVASAQLLVLDVRVYVTELRTDKNKIGTAPRLHTSTRQWVKVEGKTRIYHRGKAVSQATMWRALRPGVRIRVEGGQDWDQTIVARRISY